METETCIDHPGIYMGDAFGDASVSDIKAILAADKEDSPLKKDNTEGDVKISVKKTIEQAKDRAKDVARRVRREGPRLFGAMALLTALTLILAVVLETYEGPREKDKIDIADKRIHKLHEVILMRYFNLYLFAFNSKHYYDPDDDRCRRGNCEACFPRSENIPSPSENNTVWQVYAQARLGQQDMLGNPIYVDTNLPMLYYTNETHRCTDEQVNPSSGEWHKCIPVCRLQLPTVEQVGACALPADTIPHNPLSYNDTCLQQGATCPNCFVLTRRSSDFEYLEIDHASDPNNTRRLQKAEMYVLFKEEVEQHKIERRNWDLAGCAFFATTLLTTIGYGNYAPDTDESRIMIMVLGLPMLAVFGVGLSLLSSLVMELGTESVAAILASLRWLRGEKTPPIPNIKDIVTKWKQLLREKGIRPTESNSVEELKPVLAEVMKIFGHHDETLGSESLVEYALNKHDVDGNGTLDDTEGAALLIYVCGLLTKERERDLACTKVYLGLTLMAALFVLGSVLFWLIEDWSFIQSMYFVFITLTTIGLGDFVPSPRNYWIWLPFTLVGLGIFAFVLSLLSTLTQDTLADSVSRFKRKVLERIPSSPRRSSEVDRFDEAVEEG